MAFSYITCGSTLFDKILVGGPDQRRLTKYLLVDRQYDILERPVSNDSFTVPVSINLAIQQIIDFDGKNEVIVISGWLVLMWNDYNLMWDPKEFGNIQTIRLPSAQIWTPDILLYNSADEKFDSTMKVNAVVQHNGDILYVPPGIFKSECSFNIAAFPFDTQYCTLKFGSWTYDDTGINLTAESNKGQLDAYMKSAEWDLEDFSAVNNATKYDCCPTLYPFVLFTLKIRRRSLYYFTNIVLPCFLISCMTILGFLLAPDSGEKLTLQITILLSVVMFSLLMCEIMPPSSAAVPIITKYFMCIMVMSTISVIASVLVISVHFRTSKNHKMPIWANKYICHYLAWLLLMKRPRHDLSWKAIRRRWGPSKQESNTINNSTSNHRYKSPSAPLLSNVFESLPNNVIDVNRQSFQLIEDPNKERSESPIKYSSTSNSNKIPRSYRQQDLSREVHLFDTEMIRSELRVIISHLAILTHHTHHEEKLDNESQDWKFMAMVIDRLCLIFFTLSMALFTTLTLLSTPNFYKLQ
ncbi:unnamed protein product [Adineta steineri]|uniref:Uncharacterized protein n=1 Tax=Adineta steineri TaxID=433720 RepID=A0A815P3D8_9BILA|nr:unnamed protein product [Adineta steineri]CAF1628555.1 unnamed protein product [Adineta steineri]